MANPFKNIDPLILTMKLRDSFKNGDNTQLQNYMKDIFIKSLSQSNNNSSSSIDSNQLNENINSMVNQYLEQMSSSSDTGNYSELRNYIDTAIRQTVNQSFGKSLNYSMDQPTTNRQKKKNPGRKIKTENSDERVEIFEAHDYIIVRVGVPDNVHERNIQVHVSTNKIFIKWGLPGLEEVIQLPADVEKEGIKAVIKNRILEIIIPKEQNIDLKSVNIKSF